MFEVMRWWFRRGIDGFRIDEASDADVGQKTLAGILDGYGDDVVTLRQKLERVIDVRLEEIRHDEHDRVLIQHPRDVVGRIRPVSNTQSSPSNFLNSLRGRVR